MNDPRPDPLADRPVPRRSDAPALAAGLAAFALGNGLGEISLPRETRGAVLDWGGCYAQAARLTGPWTVVDRAGDPPMVAAWRTESVVQSQGSFRVVRTGSGANVQEELVAHPTDPCLLWRRRFANGTLGPLRISVGIAFTPILAPVLMEGIRPHEYRFEARGTTLRVLSGAFGLSYDAEPMPSTVTLDGRPWIGGRFDGPLRSVRLEHDLLVPPGGTGDLRIVLAGGRRARHAFGPVSPLVDDWAAVHRGRLRDWFAATPSLEMPGVPELVRGYDLARAALRTLYCAPEPGFRGLLAGYPWYAALWGRDLGRMLPAVLWLGDAAWAAASLDTVFAFQAPRGIPALGASAGELPMQVAPGPVFFYGTSDTSLYFPGIVRRYVDLTGDAAGARRWFDGLERVRQWAEAKVDPRSGLFRNGGELDGIRAAERAEPVRLGIDSPDTTIWDSADRRDHAVELQRLYVDLQRDLDALAGLPGAPAGWTSLGARASLLAEALVAAYRWPEEGYLYDALRTDGSPVRRVRPNALEWVGGGLLDRAEERGLVARALREDLATPWGLRTLSASDPSYDPAAYHMGQVWPIASAWLAAAALRAGATGTGTAELLRLARGFVAEGGWANECFRGDRPEPFDSCFLLGFSVAPFLVAIFEALLGISPDAGHGVLGVRPRGGPPWDHWTLTGLAFAGGRATLSRAAEELEVRWQGPRSIVVATSGGSGRVEPGASLRLPLGTDGPSPEGAGNPSGGDSHL